MAVEGRGGRPGDPAPPDPQPRQPDHLPDQVSGDGDEGDPQEGVELPRGALPEQLVGVLAGAAGPGAQLRSEEKPQESLRRRRRGGRPRRARVHDRSIDHIGEKMEGL